MTEQCSNTSAPVRTRRSARRKIVIAFAAVIVLLGVFAVFKVSSTVSAYSPLEIKFVGFTNTQSGLQHAVFSIRNLQNRTVLFNNWRNYQIYTNGDWTQRETTFKSEWVAINPLQAYATTNFAVFVTDRFLSSVDVWKMPFGWSYEAGGTDVSKAVLLQNWSALREGRSLPGRNVRVAGEGGLIYSPAITNDFQ